MSLKLGMDTIDRFLKESKERQGPISHIKDKNLKQCANCGGKSEIWNKGAHYKCACTRCGMRTVWMTSSQSAKKCWNRRKK